MQEGCSRGINPWYESDFNSILTCTGYQVQGLQKGGFLLR